MILNKNTKLTFEFILIIIFALTCFCFNAELQNAKNDMQEEIYKYEILNAEYDAISSKYFSTSEELNIANATIANLKTDEYELIYIGDYKITHYCNEPYAHICGYGKRTTATGTTTEVGRTVAVDPNVIPYGTQMYIEGYGWRIAEDCGGAVKGNHIDVLVDYHDEALSMGVPIKGVWIPVHKNPLK